MKRSVAYTKDVQHIVDYQMLENPLRMLQSNAMVVCGKKGNIIFENVCQIFDRCSGLFTYQKATTLDEDLIRNRETGENMLLVVTDSWEDDIRHIVEKRCNFCVCTWYAVVKGLQICIQELPKDVQRYFQRKVFLEYNRKNKRNLELGVHSLDQFLYSEDILVYQPGRVGSNSIADSIPHSLHTHNLRFHSMVSFLPTETVRADYERARKDNKKIISLVRNPFSRDLSLFFLETDEWLSDVYGRFNKMDDGIVEQTKRFILNIVRNGDDEFSWFDKQILEVFGIDIYQYPFDRDKGYTVIQNDRTTILLMKTERMNQLTSVIGDFAGMPNFRLHSSNEGRRKAYRFLYDEVKHRIRFPKEYVDYYLNNEKCGHFYTKEELYQAINLFGIEE